TDSLVYIVTEEAISLKDYLHQTLQQNPLRESWLCWGLYQIVTGLQFLNESAKSVYNNLKLSSIFVNNAGDWKIFRLENCRTYDEIITQENFVNSRDKYSLPDDRMDNFKKRPW
uniref:N-terminal kinase-like protein n=1 Tax=Romanomermis culicivorax TaxID=13658 RepID=A0A915JSX0_ROMCU